MAAQILLVDDEIFILADMKDQLEREGYIVHEAANSLLAFELLQRHPDIGLIVTDIRMPGTGDGLALVRYLRQAAPCTPIIVASGFEVDDDALDANNVLVMSKPIAMRAFLSAVRQLLRPADACTSPCSETGAQ